MTKTARNRLTDVAIRKAVRPFAKALSDGGNLYLAEMEGTGLLKWKVAYVLRGKRATIWLGAYPAEPSATPASAATRSRSRPARASTRRWRARSGRWRPA